MDDIVNRLRVCEIEYSDGLACGYGPPLNPDGPEAAAEIERLRRVVVDVTANLVAAVSLLECGGKEAAPSDKMFGVMIDDYKKSVERARAAIP